MIHNDSDVLHSHFPWEIVMHDERLRFWAPDHSDCGFASRGGRWQRAKTRHHEQLVHGVMMVRIA